MKLVIELEVSKNGGISVEDGMTLDRILNGFGLTIVSTDAKIAKIQTETVVEVTKEEKTTPTMPEDKKEPEEAPTEEKPKRKRRTKAEMEAETKTEVTLSELKDLAQKLAGEKGRDKVKAVISEFAGKLSDVTKDDYEALVAKLKEL